MCPAQKKASALAPALNILHLTSDILHLLIKYPSSACNHRKGYMEKCFNILKKQILMKIRR